MTVALWWFSPATRRWQGTYVGPLSGFMIECRAILQRQGFCTALERIDEGDVNGR